MRTRHIGIATHVWHLSLAFCAGVPGILAQGTPGVVLDLNTTAPAQSPGSDPAGFIRLGNYTLFAATDHDHGRELFRRHVTTGTVNLVRDINPGVADGAPEGLTVLGSVALFFVTDPAYGRELWRTDGLSSGTWMVKDIWPGPKYDTGLPELFIPPGGSVAYFGGDDGVWGRELWRTDGTTAGTRMVRDIRSGGNSAFVGELFPGIGTSFFFSANGSGLGTELWKSDGTNAGTVLVRRLNPTGGTAHFGPSVALGATVVFAAGTDSNTRPELWGTDGTPAGTVRLATGFDSYRFNTDLSLSPISGVALFAATTASGRELWRTNGTVNGTSLVRDIWPGATGSNPRELRLVGNRVVFFATAPGLGEEVWASDGTGAGTNLLADLNPGSDSSVSQTSGPAYGSNVMLSGSTLYFAAYTPTTGDELWKVSTGAPTLVVDLYPGMGATGAHSASPWAMDPVPGGIVFRARNSTGSHAFRTSGTLLSTTAYWDGTVQGYERHAVDANTVLFVADDGATGPELWHTTGTYASTALDEDIHRSLPSSSPREMVEVLGQRFAYFTADDGVRGRELWRTDGTAAGTVIEADINSEPGSSDPRSLALFSGGLCFAATEGNWGRELWKCEVNGFTSLVKDIAYGPSQSSDPGDLTAFHGRVYFSAATSSAGRELWVSDGNAAGTVLLKDIHSGGDSNPRDFLAVGDTLYFTASTGYREVWKTDGTAAGTVRVTDFRRTAGPSELVEFHGRLYFAAQDSAGEGRLWVSDGTPAGTVPLTTSFVDPHQPARHLHVVGDRLFFSFDNGQHGSEPWVSDGTTLGTRMVKDILYGDGSEPFGFADLGGIALFAASDGASGFELWRSDGTSAGTWRVADIHPGSNSSIPPGTSIHAPPGAGRAVFQATNGLNGVEPWVTDGTAAGTTMLQDLRFGVASSNCSAPVPLRGLLLFSGLATSASGSAIGEELFVMTGVASATPYGESCRGSNGSYPRIAGRGVPYLGNNAFGIQVDRALPNTVSIAFVHIAYGDFPIGSGCSYYGDPATVLLGTSATINAAGRGTVSLPIANDPALSGARLYAQHLVVDTGGAFLGQLTLTEGLKIVLAVH